MDIAIAIIIQYNTQNTELFMHTSSNIHLPMNMATHNISRRQNNNVFTYVHKCI